MTLRNKNCIITAGPTYEMIDPVRFLGNFSSGKMGYAIAEEFANRGANVKIVSGPTNLKIINNKIEKINVISADEMYNSVDKYFDEADIIVFAAAVADYKPIKYYEKKIKKKGNLLLELTKNIDIAKELGKRKNKNQIFVGFALETNNEIKNAKKKLQDKKFDMIILNSLQDKNAGFNYDTNKITIIDKNEKIEKFPLKQKTEVAKDIVNQLIIETKSHCVATSI